MTKGVLSKLAAFSHCGSGILVQSSPRPEMNCRHASHLSWLTRHLRLGVDPTVALGLSEDFPRQRLGPVAFVCASNLMLQTEGRQARRSVRKR